MAALTQNLEVLTTALMPALLHSEVVDGDDPLMAAFAPGYVDADKVQYDQYESPYGLIPLRGLNGAPPVLQMPGFRRYQFDPGYFGAETQITESDITSTIQPGTLAEPLDTADRLGKLMKDLAVMVVNRFRVTVADMLADGAVRITDSQGGEFEFQVPGYRTLTPGTGWGANPSTATPIKDLLTWKAQLQRGTSTKFGKDSVLLMNTPTLAEFFTTTQVQSTYRGKYGASFIGLDGTADLSGVNAILQGFDLPSIVPYDHGYYPTLADAKARTYTNFTYAVPTRTVLWLGVRPQQPKLGTFQLTRHAGIVNQKDGNKYPEVGVENAGMAEYAKGLFVRADYRPKMPNGYDLQVGFNGCPVLWYDDSAAGITTG
jgi:hypothetical protein